MKQSVDLMNSMKLMNSRHSNTTTTTTSLARRALLLLTLFVMSVGSAWGQTFGGTLAANGKTHPYYLGTGVPSPLNLNVLDYVSLSEMLSDMSEVAGSTIKQDDLKTSLYVRWCVEKDDATLMTLSQYNVTTSNWGFSNEPSSGQYLGKYGDSDTKFYTFAQQTYYSRNTLLPANNFAAFLSASLKIKADYQTETLDDFPGYKIVCYVGRYSASDITLSEYNESTLNSEPTNFDIRYEFLPGKKPDTFSGSLKGTGKVLSGGAVVGTADKLNASDANATLDLTAALAEVSGAKYARFYLIKDGAAVDPTGKLTVTGGTAGPELEHGFYISKPTGLTASDLSGITLSLATGEFEDYQVMCVFSADDATSLLPAKEPDWDLQYTYTFEYPFKGDATSATKVEKTFKLPASQWTTSPKEFCIDFDFTNSKILLKDKDNSATLASVDFDKTWWDTNYSGASVSGKNFYVRWFLKNKSTGVETYIAKAIRNVNGASTYKDCAKAQYGRFWSTKIGDGQTDLNNIMRIKIDGTPDSPGTVFNITDYDLVCTIGTDGSETLDGSNQVTMEPTTLQMQYTLHFEDKPFEAENLSTVKTVYKAALYDASTGEIKPSLFDPSVNAGVLSDVGKSSSAFFGSTSYARWYVVEKVTGDIVANLTDDWGFDKLSSNAYTPAYRSKAGYGWTKYQMATSDDPTITVPTALRSNYKDYQVVCVVTTDMTGASYSAWGGGSAQYEFDCEPTTMQVKYVYNLILTETEFSALPFVHYKGQSGRDWVVPDGSTGSQAQQYWDSSTGTAVDVTADMRQGVHTWEYDVYILPGEERKLVLPIQDFDNTSHDDALEPRGYFRWYDWKTDKAVVNDKFTFAAPTGTLLKSIDSRGLFALSVAKTDHPSFDNVGVTFTPDVDFSESIDIACDVSKYSDGITTISGTSYLIHEPTLSNRYIFHIHPASESAAKLQASKTTLEAAETVIKAGANNAAMHDLFVANENTMFKLAEDKGKVVVSLGASKTGFFSLRFDEHNLKNYILPDGGTGYVSADNVQWYAYFENESGIWRKKIGNTETNRITTFKFNDSYGNSDFKGEYHNLKNESGTTITDGKKFHVVGYVGKGTFNPVAGTGNYAPVVHYELHFIEAPAIPVQSLSSNLERTDAYMKYHYDLAGTVDFDGNPETNENVTGHEKEYYSTANWSDAPTSSANNMTWTPFPWDDNQYGFCYPQLTPTIKYGMDKLYVSPEHGDYIIVKSMNADWISNDDSDVTAPHRYDWWETSTLYDYTHTVTDNSKYGSFLYTDASDESRTIATIPFTADLCHGSSIYFTAAVAHMTSGTEPQLLIRIVGIDGTGKRHRVVAFHTCDIISTGGTAGVWNQIYGMSTIPVDFDDEITHFVAEVINYAKDTRGADFAIDELKVFTNTSKVMLAQTGSSCAEPTAGKLKVYMDAEGLQNVFGKSDTEQTIYWRICREEDGSVVTGLGMYPQYDGGGTLIPDNDPGNLHTYGMSKVKSNFNPAMDVKDEAAREADAYGWYKAADNTIYFQLANQNFPALEEGGHYYVSVYDPNQTFDASKESFWGGLHFGATSKCSVFSNFFIPRRQYVTYTDGAGGAEGGDLMVACGGASSVSGVQMILKVPDVAEPTGFKSFDDLHYDFVFVHLDTWNSNSATFNHGGTDYKYVDLKTALAHYRGASSIYKDVVGLHADYQSVNSTNYNLLSYAIAEGLLALDYSTKFTHTFSGSDYTVTCQPAEQSVTISSGETTVCSPFEVTFSLKGSSPELELGFSDVVYPPAYTKRVLRLGLEQLKNLRENGYKLHVPIRLYKDRDKKTDNTLSFTSEYLTLSAVSSDPTTTTGAKFAKIVSPTDPSAAPVVDAGHMYLTLDFSGTNCTIDFHEGFEYEVSTSYFDSRDAGVSGRCQGDIYLVVKIVPEFVTWNPYAIDATYYNVNWNNDTNWQRSSRTELYKGDKGSTTNTATAGHPDGYENNGEGGLSSINSTPQTYVPMKFSYVTLPANCKAPSLINMDITAYPGSDYTGGILLAGDLGTDRSPKGGTSDATSYIKYDMLVRYSYDSSDKQNECQGHYMSDGVTIIGKGDTKIYDCEKFYGNICREIYFKPGAEMINQQRLTYQKAWVEKEMDRNKWYLLSAPLKGTYAGDMYVPKANGQQDTEAFQPISFNSTTYSRTAYPIYQRSWDHSQDGGKVYTETSDPRATQYSANLKFNGAVTSTFAQWTHTYNDMAVNYTALQGFALRAHKKDGTVGEKAVIRLPKADESYTYYNYNDAAGTVTSTTTKGAGVYGRFVTDDCDNKATMTTMPLDEANINTDNEYCLVGNPYMSSIDMAAFFAKNSHLTGQYWMVDGNPSAGLSTGQIKPMTSFFVKTTDRSKGVNFDNSMMIDGNANPNPGTSPSREFTLTASSNRGQSAASVSVGEEEKSVETLFDSNLTDVPMVYTVADGQAVSINQVKELSKPIAFGVTCTASNEMVDVTFSDIEKLTSGEVYVVDAVDGTSQQIYEGDSFAVQPNDYGRYFLTFTGGSATGIEETASAQQGIVVSVRGREVTVTSGEDISQIQAVSLNGSTIYQNNSCGNSVTFMLHTGVYVIQAKNIVGAQQNVKIFVK